MRRDMTDLRFLADMRRSPLVPLKQNRAIVLAATTGHKPPFQPTQVRPARCMLKNICGVPAELPFEYRVSALAGRGTRSPIAAQSFAPKSAITREEDRGNKARASNQYVAAVIGEQV
jgi:hypothetical protein